MIEMFSHAWTSSNGIEPTPGVWCNLLETLSSEQIKRGLLATALLDKEFPPNPGQFRSLCSRTQEQVNLENPPQKLLPEPLAKPETVARELKKMREMLK